MLFGLTGRKDRRKAWTAAAKEDFVNNREGRRAAAC
jgi:hypothetical protein